MQKRCPNCDAAGKSKPHCKDLRCAWLACGLCGHVWGLDGRHFLQYRTPSDFLNPKNQKDD